MSAWLQINASPRQLHLRELCGAYQIFDDLGHKKPSVVQVIGGKDRSQDLANLTTINHGESDTINLYSFAGPKRPVVLVDCGAALRFKPSKCQLSNTKRPGCHVVRSFVPGWSAFPTAVSLFSRLIAGICQTVVIFVDDNLGLSGVLELIASWVRLRQYDIRSRPRLLLVSKMFSNSADEEFRQRIWRYLLRVQQMADPTELYKRDDVEKMFWDSFESLHLLSASLQVNRAILSEADEMSSRRHASRWEFSALNLRRIFHGALIHYSTEAPRSFDYVLALQNSTVSSAELSYHIRWLIRMACKRKDNIIGYFIASALHANAYPKRGHGK